MTVTSKVRGYLLYKPQRYEIVDTPAVSKKSRIPRLILLMLSLAIAAPADARIARRMSAKVAFVRYHACPATGAYKLPCHGYVIDHINPLACGGPDAPSNMQWQTFAEGKAKDKWERKSCGK